MGKIFVLLNQEKKCCQYLEMHPFPFYIGIKFIVKYNYYLQASLSSTDIHNLEASCAGPMHDWNKLANSISNQSADITFLAFPTFFFFFLFFWDFHSVILEELSASVLPICIKQSDFHSVLY